MISESPNQMHIQAAIDWICNAQDVAKDGGVAGWFSFLRGWAASYPETTGYIIPTFLKYYKKTNKEEFKERAIRMADFLIAHQLETGAFAGHCIGMGISPRIFNTGMALFGLLGAFKETKVQKYLDATVRAAEFIIQMQDNDGAWRKYSYNNFAHSYYARVSWALLELNDIMPNERYSEAAISNLGWTTAQKEANGWFNNTSFEKNKDPFLHTIAYLAEGLLESGIKLNEEKYIEEAIALAGRLREIFEIKGYLPSIIDRYWNARSKSSCLTGDAQMSIVWQKIFKLIGDGRFLSASSKINAYLRSKQILNSPFKSLKGGICGSDPIWGSYLPFWIPNWAVKFFLDALLMEEEMACKLR